MKGENIRSAEDWVQVARQFGEDCVKIQQDSKLSLDQKLEKQKVLGNKMAKEIETDPHLNKDDKRQMVESIRSYMHEWETMHDIIQKGEKATAKK